MTREGFVVGVHLHVGLLSGLHVAKLRLLEVGRDPDVFQRHDDEQALTGLHDLARFNGLVRGHAVHGRDDVRVTQIELRRIELSLGTSDGGGLRLGIGRAHGHTLLVGFGGIDTGRGLRDAGLGCVQLRAGNIDVALGLGESLLVGDQRARRGVGIGLRRVILLLGDLALFHERLVALKIGSREFRVGAALLHVGLGDREIRRLRLFVSSRSARQVRLRAEQLCLGARSSAVDGLAGSRNIDTGRTRLAFGQFESGLGLVNGGLIVGRIDLHEDLTGLNGLVVIHKNLGNPPVDLRRNGRNVAVNLGVVGGLAVAKINEQSDENGDEHAANDHEGAANLRTDQRLWRRLQRWGLR